VSDLPLVSAGDKLPRSAALFNEWTSAARLAHRIDNSTAPPANQAYGPQDTIRVYNDTGIDIEWQYAIVGLKEPIYLPEDGIAEERTFKTTPTLKIEYPCTDMYRGRFAVLQGPLKDGKCGVAAILSGKFIALVDDGVLAGDAVDVDEAARQDDNSLSTVAGGVATCLWAGPGSDPDLPVGTRWGLMRFGGGGGGGAEIVSFTISSASCETGTAEASVTRVACGLSSPSVGDSINLIDDDGCYLLGDNALLIGRNGKAVRMEGDYECGWYIISLCCGSLSSC
jgi:hypothetical protein